jgi:hypothetical protein
MSSDLPGSLQHCKISKLHQSTTTVCVSNKKVEVLREQIYKKANSRSSRAETREIAEQRFCIMARYMDEPIT